MLSGFGFEYGGFTVTYEIHDGLPVAEQAHGLPHSRGSKSVPLTNRS